MVLLAGPSGSGKSRLCGRFRAELGLPTVNLDDFYKDGADPTLPRLDAGATAGQVDWDDPASWFADQALETLGRLCTEGRAEVPVYDIARNGRVGSRVVTLGDAPLVVAEGVFAQELVATCTAHGLLGLAVCVGNRLAVTFWRRLVRDLRERRKPPWVLLTRGLRLMRAEPDVVDRAVRHGCVALTAPDAFDRVASLLREPGSNMLTPTTGSGTSRTGDGSGGEHQMTRLIVDGRDVAPVEVAGTSRSRSKGLLGRSGLEGAMWLAPARQVHTFRMRFALDVAHLAKDGTVLHTVTMPPGRLGRWVWRGRGVIEAEAGAFADWGVRVGSTLLLTSPDGDA